MALKPQDESPPSVRARPAGAVARLPLLQGALQPLQLSGVLACGGGSVRLMHIEDWLSIDTAYEDMKFKFTQWRLSRYYTMLSRMSLGMIPTCFLEPEVVAEPDQQLEALEVLREAHVDGLVAVQRLLVVAGATVARRNHQLPLHLERTG